MLVYWLHVPGSGLKQPPENLREPWRDRDAARNQERDRGGPRVQQSPYVQRAPPNLPDPGGAAPRLGCRTRLDRAGKKISARAPPWFDPGEQSVALGGRPLLPASRRRPARRR